MGTVLVCDNEEVLRSLVRASLAETGHTVAEARDGDESLELARELRPDVIVLDMVMPGRTGIDVLAELRADPELARVPVVMLTAGTQITERDAALEAGANRFLPKPFSPLKLAAVVQELVAQPR